MEALLRPALRAIAPLQTPRADPPAFAHAIDCARIDEPFREGVAAVCRAPGDVVLYAQLPPIAGLASVPLHWEVARDAAMQQRERYGLLSVRPGATLQVALRELEKGRPYWFRMWAGGHWSHTGHFNSGARARPDLTVCPRRPRTERPMRMEVLGA